MELVLVHEYSWSFYNDSSYVSDINVERLSQSCCMGNVSLSLEKIESSYMKKASTST